MICTLLAIDRWNLNMGNKGFTILGRKDWVIFKCLPW